MVLFSHTSDTMQAILGSKLVRRTGTIPLRGQCLALATHPCEQLSLKPWPAPKDSQLNSSLSASLHDYCKPSPATTSIGNHLARNAVNISFVCVKPVPQAFRAAQ